LPSKDFLREVSEEGKVLLSRWPTVSEKLPLKGSELLGERSKLTFFGLFWEETVEDVLGETLVSLSSS